jgi:hypothetical protein
MRSVCACDTQATAFALAIVAMHLSARTTGFQEAEEPSKSAVKKLLKTISGYGRSDAAFVTIVWVGHAGTGRARNAEMVPLKTSSDRSS